MLPVTPDSTASKKYSSQLGLLQGFLVLPSTQAVFVQPLGKQN